MNKTKNIMFSFGKQLRLIYHRNNLLDKLFLVIYYWIAGKSDVNTTNGTVSWPHLDSATKAVNKLTTYYKKLQSLPIYFA